MYNQIDSNKRRTWLLMILFVVLISVLGYFIGQMTNYGNSMIIFALIISFFMALFSYYGGDKVALMTSGAILVKTREENPYLWNMVENLSITAGVAMPKVYVIPDEAINAFATGRDPKHASIAVTAGAIRKLENEELEGVIAHELSHVKNYDIRLMMIVIVLVGTIALLADMFFRASLFGGKRDNEKGSPVFMIIGFVLIILSPIAAQLIQLAISRKREYLADASGALLTRYPEGLARALEKINNDSAVMEKANNATAHLYISNPFKNSGKLLARAFSTHPPIEDRVKKLREMA